MKDSLFELLLNLVEKTITHLKEQHEITVHDSEVSDSLMESPLSSESTARVVSIQLEMLKSATNESTRVFTQYEQTKLTKASYQFLMRMVSLGVISSELLELVVNRLIFSDSRFVSLQETKWAFRATLANGLSPEQLAFLDLILYQQEDRFSLH